MILFNNSKSVTSAGFYNYISDRCQRHWFNTKQVLETKTLKVNFLTFLRFTSSGGRKSIVCREKIVHLLVETFPMFACDMLMVLCYHFLYCFYYYVIILVSYRCVLESIMGNTNNKAVCETKEAVQSFLKYARKKAKSKKRKLNE